MSEMNTRIALFDVDGTLTVPMNDITEDMVIFLKELRKQVPIAIVGGSDFNKIKKHVKEENLLLFDYVFSENGLVSYRNNDDKLELICKESFKKYLAPEVAPDVMPEVEFL